MTTKQNAIELARTALSEAANTAKRTISAIINNWNECVKQAGFTGVFDFPTTGYTRKSQLIADFERCAAQLDDYVEPNPYAAQTVEQQIREFNAVLTRVLDADEAHAEALEINGAYNTLYVYAAGDAAQDVWPHLTEVERAVSVEFAHKQALHDNRQHDDAIEYFAAYGSRLYLEAFTQHQIKQIADFCHSDALEINSAYRECA